MYSMDNALASSIRLQNLGGIEEMLIAQKNEFAIKGRGRGR